MRKKLSGYATTEATTHATSISLYVCWLMLNEYFQVEAAFFTAPVDTSVTVLCVWYEFLGWAICVVILSLE